MLFIAFLLHLLLLSALESFIFSLFLLLLPPPPSKSVFPPASAGIISGGAILSLLRLLWQPFSTFVITLSVPSIPGDDEIYHRGSLHSNFVDSSLLLSLAPNMDVYCPPRKRQRVTAASINKRNEKVKSFLLEKQQLCSIDALPDECLFEIFRRIPGNEERRTAACVSKRWLMLLSTIQASEVMDVQLGSSRKPLPDLNLADTDVFEEDMDNSIECNAYLARCLEAEDATDTRLAFVAINSVGHGGLGKLQIRGGIATCKASDVGLAAIGRCCPSLRVLSMWNVPLVSDAGLVAVANGCPMLENLDLFLCPRISDDGLIAIAKKCPNLTSLILDSCSGISNGGLQAIGRCCPKLLSVTVKDCPLVGDKGVSGLVAFASSSLVKIKLQNANITDVSLAVIGHYGKSITELSLKGLQNVSERGFWVMGNALNMKSLASCTISSCPGLTDLGLEAISKGCPQLNHLCIQRSCNLSDAGLRGFSESSRKLERMHLEECNRITLCGVLDGLLKCNLRLRSLALVKCLGISDITCYVNELPTSLSLRSLSIRDCPGFTSCSLALVGKICPNLRQIDLSGLVGVTDVGLLPLVKNSECQLVKVKLGGCLSLSDESIFALVKAHGSSLELLNLEGCSKVSDKSLMAIVKNCSMLKDLDISRCNISDLGIAALASAKQLNLRILSLAGCSRVTKKSLSHLGKMKLSLEGLNLQQCKLINAHESLLPGDYSVLRLVGFHQLGCPTRIGFAS
ncbi:EIN3-binding F-box protein 1 [Apostasia shenzhenica]|uniref:EIN3-binding F-box protein 1 n=1 Tax=Apostasia shenzhenica TaxID=1088818 RepID=A0A2I0AJX5_9ASPA|nr:EIN3-binding F-box protein 1 [Apostasia shenzhenica]